MSRNALRRQANPLHETQQQQQQTQQLITSDYFVFNPLDNNRGGSGANGDEGGGAVVLGSAIRTSLTQAQQNHISSSASNSATTNHNNRRNHSNINIDDSDDIDHHHHENIIIINDTSTHQLDQTQMPQPTPLASQQPFTLTHQQRNLILHQQANAIVTHNINSTPASPLLCSNDAKPNQQQQPLQTVDVLTNDDVTPSKLSKLDSIINRLKTNKASSTHIGAPQTRSAQIRPVPSTFCRLASIVAQQRSAQPQTQQVATITLVNAASKGNNNTDNIDSKHTLNKNNRPIANRATQTLVTTGTMDMNPGALNIKPSEFKSSNNPTADLASLLATIIGKGKSSGNNNSTNNNNNNNSNHNKRLGKATNNTDTNPPNLFVDDELFKQQLQRIDSEIRLIAAHSKNKLYSLTGFATLDNKGSGPSRPSDLPPRLPPPPPWIPKRGSDCPSTMNKSMDLTAGVLNNIRASISRATSSTESTTNNNQAAAHGPRRSNHNNNAQSLLARNEFKRLVPSVNGPVSIHSSNHPNLIVNNNLVNNRFASKIRVTPADLNNLNINYLKQRTSPYARPLPSGASINSLELKSSLVRAITNNNRLQQFYGRQIAGSGYPVASSIVKVVIPPVKSKIISHNGCSQKVSFETDDKLKEEYNNLNKKLQTFQKNTSISFKSSPSRNNQLDRSVRDSSSSPNENVVQDESHLNFRERIDPRQRTHIPTFKIHRDGIIPMASKQKQEPIVPSSFGLQLNNYLDRERPQPNTDSMNVDQFASCLNLVRKLDFEREKEFKEQNSISKFRLPISERPLRLRRLRGDQFNVPASASYKATRKVGLK